MAREIHIGYIGPDQRYWRRLKTDLTDEYGNVCKPNFHHFDNFDKKDFLAAVKILLDRPCHIIYLDFCDQMDVVLKLASLLQRLNCFKKMVIIGLYSNNEYPKMEILAQPIGLHALHLKSSEETHDAIYSAMFCALPSLAKKPGTFSLDLSRGKEFTVFEVCRINFTHATGLHFETCVPYKMYEPIKLQHSICRDLIKSEEFKVSAFDQGPLYYNSKMGVSIDFEYLDVIAEPTKNHDAIETARILDEIELRRRQLIKIKDQYAKWLEKPGRDSVPKRTKLLIIDPTLKIISHQNSMVANTNISLRLQTHLINAEIELQSYLPDFIAMEYCEATRAPAATEEEATTDTDSRLYAYEQTFFIPSLNDLAIKNVITAIQKIRNYSPFIIIFGKNDLTSQKARTQYAYPKMVAAQGPISPHTLVDMAKTFDKKYDLVNEATGPKLFFAKQDPWSFCYRPLTIKLVNISEFELYFETDQPIPPRTTFKITTPLAIFFTTTPIPENSAFANRYNIYRGIIHLLSRQQIEDLRKFVIKKDV